MAVDAAEGRGVAPRQPGSMNACEAWPATSGWAARRAAADRGRERSRAAHAIAAACDRRAASIRRLPADGRQPTHFRGRPRDFSAVLGGPRRASRRPLREYVLCVLRSRTSHASVRRIAPGETWTAQRIRADSFQSPPLVRVLSWQAGGCSTSSVPSTPPRLAGRRSGVAPESSGAHLQSTQRTMARRERPSIRPRVAE